jgi:hypothetical protein
MATRQRENAEIEREDSPTIKEGRADDGDRRSTQWGSEPLLPEAESEALTARWEQIQVRFVDEPQAAVEQADELVDALMKRLAQGFAEARSTLESQWDRHDDVSTEDLRVALQRYRSFFQRLLAA